MAFKRILELIENNDSVILFVDEAVFTSRLQLTKAWTKNYRRPPVVYINKLGFAAVAVTGAIDIEGKLISIVEEAHSINVDKFLTFLRDVRAQYLETQVIYIFLDNLRVHYS